MKCDQCCMTTINSVHLVHERGCPNEGKLWSPKAGAWVKVYECRECGSPYSDADDCARCCQPNENPEWQSGAPNETEFREDMIALAKALIPDIRDDYRASDDPGDSAPGMQVTVGAEFVSPDSFSWNYQTGDNSFTGGAYGFPFWGSAPLYRDTKPEDFADEIISSLTDNDQFTFGE